MQGLPAGPSLDDLIPSHLRAYIGPSSRGSRVSEQQGKGYPGGPAVDGDTSRPGEGAGDREGKEGRQSEERSREPPWLPQEARLWLCPGYHPFPLQWNLWALSLPAPGPSPQVPVIRNGGSNTLNFQFHDPAPRTVCNGYAPPRRDGSQHPGGSAWEDLL